jgi:hypothetical protein
MAVASTAIMIIAPEDRAGMAGSIETICYELGGTLGVAVMGSLMATVFSQAFLPPSAFQWVCSSSLRVGRSPSLASVETPRHMEPPFWSSLLIGIWKIQMNQECNASR